MEVNDHPSLNIYFSDNDRMEGKRYTDEDICQVDYYVKTRLVQDTLDLVRKARSTVADTNDFRSLTKIHPPFEEGGDMYSLVRDLHSVFYSLCTIRDKA